MQAWKVLLLLGLMCGTARADSVTCFSFVATPETYEAPAGGSFTVLTTFTNCGAEGYAFIGSGFGSDEDPYFDFFGAIFWDPFAIIAPGDSLTLGFATYYWTPDAPEGYSQIYNINAEFEFFEGPCDFGTIPCVPLEGSSGGFAWTQFTASVPGPQSEVPEPSTILLLSTGAAMLAMKLKRASQTRT